MKTGIAIIFVILACVVQSSPVRAENKYDMYEIFDRFVISSAAASRCYKPSEQELKKFQVQYLNIMINTKLRMAEDHPGENEEQQVLRMKDRSEELSSRVDDIIDEEGCDAQTAKDLVELFKFHAAVDLMQPPQ